MQTQPRRGSLAPVDAPIDEARETYRVGIVGTAAALDLSVEAPSISLSAAQLVALGTGPLMIEVRQSGDFGVSQPARLTVQQ